jgi:hypothetical protein
LFCSFLHTPDTSSLSAPNILLSTLFSDTLSLWSSLNIWGQDAKLKSCMSKHYTKIN